MERGQLIAWLVNAGLGAIGLLVVTFVWRRNRGKETWLWTYIRINLRLFKWFLIFFAFWIPIVTTSAVLSVTGHEDLARIAVPVVFVAQILVIVAWWFLARRIRRRRLEIEQERERSLPFAKLRD
jgi:hypothetical protein